MIKQIWKFFCSVKLTVVLFILILLPSIAGTIIQQNAPDPTRYEEIYGPTLDGVFRFLGFYDIYHDPRFITLLVLLGLNTFACTINRFRPKWNMAGMLMTHFGLLLILVGALAGSIFGLKGFMIIREGETTNRIRSGRATDTMDTLPFSVKLVDFILDFHEKPDDRLYLLDEQSGEQEMLVIEEGKTVPLTESRWRGLKSLAGIRNPAGDSITVNRIIPHAAMTTSLTEGPEETGIAAAEFRIIRENGQAQQGFARTQLEHPYVLEEAGLAVGYMEIANRDLVEQVIQRLVRLLKTSDRLEVVFPDGARTLTFPATVGARYEIGDTGYSMELLRYVPDFSMDFATREVRSKSDFPNNPAMQLELTGPTGPKRQWVFAKFPSMHDTGDLPFELKFKVEGHLGGISDYVLILNTTEADSDESLLLAQLRGGQVVQKDDIASDRPANIEGTGYKIVVDRLLENANMDNELVNRPDISNRSAVEAVIERAGSRAKLNLWERAPADIGGIRIVYVREDKIRDFYSILQVVEEGEVVAEKKIEVNDPLRHAGYSLYQSSYDDENLSWSGLQVKKDPGVPLVYAGFLVQILGMTVIFYVNPLIRKAKRKKA
jgi:hypothetical protein